MTSTQELRALIAKAEARGATITVTKCAWAELEGRDVIESVQVAGLRGVGPFPMGAVAAAERLRQVLAA